MGRGGRKGQLRDIHGRRHLFHLFTRSKARSLCPAADRSFFGLLHAARGTLSELGRQADAAPTHESCEMLVTLELDTRSACCAYLL